MSTEASPRPWRVEDSDTIRDADGGVVVSALNPCNRATRRLIVDAVNERDRLAANEARYRTDNVRLRDIVRRLLPLAETTVENIRALGAARFPFLEDIKSARLRGDINRESSNAESLLREARAAIVAETR